MSSRLILSLRHHAAMQDPLSNNNKTSNPIFTAKHGGGAYSQHHAGGAGAFGIRTDIGEKGTTDIGGMQAHIALDNLNSTFRKGDEESQDGHQTHTIPGVYVVTETKTAVDDHRLG